MNSAQIHLALTHAPLFLSLIGGVILIWGMIRKNEPMKKLSLFLLMVAAVFTIPVYLTGEGTEEMVEHIAGVNESSIEKHEEMAKFSLIIIMVSGIIAAAGLILRRNTAVVRVIFTGALVLSFASFGAMAQTAHLGGLIRHPELTNAGINKESSQEEEGSVKNQTDSALQPKEKENAEDED